MFRRVNLISRVLRTQNIAFASTATARKKPIPLITCKNTKFNLMIDENIQKSVASKNESNEIELASKGWQHYKAKGDHFIIHSSRNVIDSNLANAKRFDAFPFNKQLIKNLSEKHDIQKATKLQVESIECIMKGQHALIAAETGCGKV